MPSHVYNVVPGDDVLVISDVLTGLTDKSTIVPAGRRYHVLAVRVVLTATVATELVLEVLSPSGVVVDQVNSTVTQAGATTYTYTFAMGGGKTGAAVGTTPWVPQPLPAGWVLQPGEQLRIYNQLAPAAGDDMLTHVRVAVEGT